MHVDYRLSMPIQTKINSRLLLYPTRQKNVSCYFMTNVHTISKRIPLKRINVCVRFITPFITASYLCLFTIFNRNSTGCAAARYYN